MSTSPEHPSAMHAPAAHRRASRWRARARRVAASTVLLAALALPAAAEEWAPGPVGIGRIDHANALVVTRGEATAVLRLAGVEAANRHDGELSTQAVDALRRWLEDGRGELLDARPGTRTDLIGMLRTSSGALVNAELIRNGYALVDPTGVSEGYAQTLVLAQQEAKANGAGLWGRPLLPADRVRTDSAQIATVCGAVGSMRRDSERGGLIHLGGAYPRNQLVIEVREEIAGLVLGRMRLEQEICVTGRLEPTAIVPRVLVVDEMQIRPRRPEGR